MTQQDIEPDVPVFGTGAIPTQKFGLVVHGPDGETTEYFLAYREADAGAVFAMQRARTDVDRANAAAQLLMSACVDNDGLPLAYELPSKDDDEDDVEPEDGSEAEDPESSGGPELDEDGVDVRYHDPSQWSSRRRFADLLDDPNRRVKLAALSEIAQWLTERATGRPTGKSKRSSRGRR